MQLSNVSVGDVINMCLLITALFGLLFTYLQLKENYKTQKATF